MHGKIMFTTMLLFICTSVAAGTLQLNSGDKQTVLLELYTSEGCSSCPPAERYLNSYIDKAGLWKNIIPMAFHVDYWDYLGWQDRFANPGYSSRQRTYAILQRNRTVYTPAFFVNGRSWRPGLFSKGEPPQDQTAAGKLAVTLEQQNLTAIYTPEKHQAEAYTLNMALLGMGLQSRIAAGENEGRLARHEFVVIGLNKTTNKSPQWKLRLPAINPRINTDEIKRYAIAVWVSRHNNPFPLQATAGYLPDTFKLMTSNKKYHKIDPP